MSLGWAENYRPEDPSIASTLMKWTGWLLEESKYTEALSEEVHGKDVNESPEWVSFSLVMSPRDRTLSMLKFLLELHYLH